MLLLVLLLNTAIAGSDGHTAAPDAAAVLQERRAAAEDDATSTLLAWGDALLAALDAGHPISLGRDVKPCLRALERAAKLRPNDASSLRVKAAEILAKTGRSSTALEMAWLAVGAELNPQSLKLLLALQKQVDPTQIGATCYIVRSSLQDDEHRLLLLQSCLDAAAPSPFPTALPWASAEDLKFYQAHLDQLAQKAAAEQAAKEEAERRAAMLVPPTGPGSRRVTEVTGRVACAAGVRLFKGTARGTGTYGWYYPKDNLFYSIREGDQLCLCDDRDQRSNCWTATGAPTASLVVTCGGIDPE